MRGRTALVLLGIAAVAAYAVGLQNAPATSTTSFPSSIVAKPVTLVSPTVRAPGPVPALPNATPSVKADLPAKPIPQDNKRKVEAALTAAAIAAIIVQARRDQYHAGGRPCACPDDSMREMATHAVGAAPNPDRAVPRRFAIDVTAAMIETYRQRQASR